MFKDKDIADIRRLLRAIGANRRISNTELARLINDNGARTRRLLRLAKDAGYVMVLDGVHVNRVDGCCHDGSQWWGPCRLLTSRGAAALNVSAAPAQSHAVARNQGHEDFQYRIPRK
jgi:hypothetical protein